METPEDALKALKRELGELETNHVVIQDLIEDKKRQIAMFDHVHVQKKPYFEITITRESEEGITTWTHRNSVRDEVDSQIMGHYFERTPVLEIRIEKKKKE